MKRQTIIAAVAGAFVLGAAGQACAADFRTTVNLVSDGFAVDADSITSPDADHRLIEVMLVEKVSRTSPGGKSYDYVMSKQLIDCAGKTTAIRDFQFYQMDGTHVDGFSANLADAAPNPPGSNRADVMIRVCGPADADTVEMRRDTVRQIAEEIRAKMRRTEF